jgi:5'-nucleotidase
MRVLLCNDDGYLAPGLQTLASALIGTAEVTVVAPERDFSGASNSLTLRRPLRVQRGENGFLYVDGTPTDCVHLAITGLMEQEPDIVISGINSGANLGDDVIYSGTVAAAMEGRWLGYPSVALSLAGTPGGPWKNFATAGRVALKLLEGLRERPLAPQIILNVNVPDVPYEQLAGYRVTRLGHRHKSEPVVRAQDPHGRPVFWVGPPGPEQDAGEGTDFHAVRNRMVSVTPIQVDLTRHHDLDVVAKWLGVLG